MLEELTNLQRGVVSVLEDSPAVVRDAYIDIFDAMNFDMQMSGLTVDRAVQLIRTNPRIRRT